MKKDESAVEGKAGHPTVAGIIIRVLLSLSVVALLVVFITVVFRTNYDEGAQTLVDLMNNVK